MFIVQYDFATPTYQQAIELRDRVLRQPLGMSIADDPLEEEYNQIHIAAVDAHGKLWGTASLLPTNKGYKLRQMAVSVEKQGKGIGAQILAEAERLAQQNQKHLYCHAREVALGFYQKRNWNPVGDKFEEVGVPHYLCEWNPQ